MEAVSEFWCHTKLRLSPDKHWLISFDAYGENQPDDIISRYEAGQRQHVLLHGDCCERARREPEIPAGCVRHRKVEKAKREQTWLTRLEHASSQS